MSWGELTRKPGDFWKITFVFLLVGPYVGGLIFGVWIFLDQVLTQDRHVMSLLWAPLAALNGYFVGGIPAVLAGMVAAALSPRVRSNLLWIGLSIACGYGFSVVPSFWADGGRLWLGPIGAAAALASALASLPIRLKARS